MHADQAPILSVRELKTYFFPDEGTVRAVDGASFDVYPRKTLGIVGESGCGKSVTAKSILRIVERPGRIVGGSILLRRLSGNGGPAELAGCNQMRIILTHLVPSFLSHIIAATTLAIPAMIISETSLSFLGLGLRPPAISWGVLLQQAQNVQALAISPWLLIPSIPVTIVILAFNFMGDGLRDAADPYGQ